MKNKDLLNHQKKLKSVYKRSKLKEVFLQHLRCILADKRLYRIIDYNLKELKKYNDSKNIRGESSVTFTGFYPCYLRYDDKDIKATVDCMNMLPIEVDKVIVKKELLRRFFLLTFENFLSRKPYGIDFSAYYKIPVNSIRFTTEYQNSGKLFKDFFKE